MAFAQGKPKLATSNVDYLWELLNGKRPRRAKLISPHVLSTEPSALSTERERQAVMCVRSSKLGTHYPMFLSRYPV